MTESKELFCLLVSVFDRGSRRDLSAPLGLFDVKHATAVTALVAAFCARRRCRLDRNKNVSTRSAVFTERRTNYV